MGSFIVSLDCEGKWGMADHLEPYHHRLLTDSALAEVYDRLVALFARHDVPATFAYVMAFTLTPVERRHFAQLLEPRDSADDPWMRHFWAAQKKGLGEGWFQPHALEAVRADGRHEIACHGFCHRPLGDQSISEEAARTELDAAAAVAEMKGISLKTFIFPRNEVGHLMLLRRMGIIGYRARLERAAGMTGRISRFVDEFNLWSRPQPEPHGGNGGLVTIPAGYFHNWRFGARRYIPLWLTIARWKRLLDRAAEEGGVAHLLLHPHNLITGPDTATSLEAILAYAAELREQGKLMIETQQQFCTRIGASAPRVGARRLGVGRGEPVFQ